MTTTEMAPIYKWAKITDPWQLVQNAISAGATRIFAWGPPGVGKSHMGAQLNKKFYQLTLDEDATTPMLVGHMMPPKGNQLNDAMVAKIQQLPGKALSAVMPLLAAQGWTWHDGPVARAMREGVPLVVNEIQRASSSVQDMMLGVLDDPEVCCLSLPSGEQLRPADGFVAILTSNEDESALDEAFKDRMDIIIHLPAPNPALIEHLNAQLAGLGDVIRDTYKDPGREVGARRALTFLRLRKGGMSDKAAAAVAFRERAQDMLNVLSARGVKVELS